MLESIQEFLGIGKIIYAENDNIIRITINGFTNCLILKDHFVKYPLMTYKLVHFKL
jgi:hypothetical protein